MGETLTTEKFNEMVNAANNGVVVFNAMDERMMRNYLRESMVSADIVDNSYEANELMSNMNIVTGNSFILSSIKTLGAGENCDKEMEQFVDKHKCEVGFLYSICFEKNQSVEPAAEEHKVEEKEMMAKESDKVKKSIYELLEEDIMTSDLPVQEKNERLSRVLKARARKVNILLTGATGAGKSSTINALFNMEVAKVGVGVDPETDVISKYELDNLIIWDTPGVGDGIEADAKYNKMIVKKMSEMDEHGEPLIDLVLVVLDASSKDLGASYNLINNVLIPCLGKDKDGRILIGLNQADVAMKGMHWDAKENKPDDILLDFLKKKAASVKRRIFDATGLSIRPIYYSAGYKEEGKEQSKPYNLTKLLYYIVKSVPSEKRLAIVDNINMKDDMWLYDDAEIDYKTVTKMSFFESVEYHVEMGMFEGGMIGEDILGIPGKIAGTVIGAGCGLIKGFFEGIFG